MNLYPLEKFRLQFSNDYRSLEIWDRFKLEVVKTFDLRPNGREVEVRSVEGNLVIEKKPLSESYVQNIEIKNIQHIEVVQRHTRGGGSLTIIVGEFVQKKPVQGGLTAIESDTPLKNHAYKLDKCPVKIIYHEDMEALELKSPCGNDCSEPEDGCVEVSVLS